MQRYASNDVCFVGIWGMEGSDKGYFWDRVLELYGVEGEKYEGIGRENGNEELYFY